ncbi:MAG: glycosyltransferase family 2 protein [Chloroflexota bacterium]|nr:glycosyltransferase family 2 protein [Chloroflexota bacterium]
MTKLSIIVPTYNEVESLPILADRIHHCLRDIDYELVVVDDNSPDGTGALAEELANTRPIKIVHRQGKLGLASAVIEGFCQASGDVLGVIDADLQHPPEKIPDLYQKIGQADIVIASRYVNGGGMEGWTFIREFISRGAKILPQFLFAKIRSVKDPLSGFFLFKKAVIEGIELNPIGYKILLEILIKGDHNGVAEVPYVFKGRERGTSTFNTTEQINYLKHLWRLIRTERETERFVKFCMVGLSGVMVNLGMLALLTEVAGLFYAISAVIAIELSILNNFTWNELWTFQDRRTSASNSTVSRLVKFNTVSLLGLGLNTGILVLLTEVAGLYYIVSAIFGIIAATLLNFVFNKWWTWQ